MGCLFQRLSTDTFNIILLIGLGLLFIEVVFFNGWLIFSVIISSILIYVGWKSFEEAFGKILVTIGAISLFCTIINMIAVRFFVIAIIVLFILDYQRMKKEPVEYKTEQLEHEKEPLYKVKPYFRNRIFGDQYTSGSSYHWTDVNIHSGFGDRVLDLSNTVLPDQAHISIRHFVGNIIIYVPYEIEVSVHHSSIFGRASILGKHHEKLLNDTLSYRTENYDELYPRVKIVTSILSGDLEVKRI